jgi:hypothetical protein
MAYGSGFRRSLTTSRKPAGVREHATKEVRRKRKARYTDG